MMFKNFFSNILRIESRLIRRCFKSKTGLYIYPHSYGRSFHLRLPYTLFLLTTMIFSIIILSAGYLSINDLFLKYSEYSSHIENQTKKKLVFEYKSLIKDYLVNHSLKEKKVENTIATLFASKKQIGVGGSQENPDDDISQNIDRFANYSDDWSTFFSKHSDQEFINFIDDHLKNFNEIFTLVDKFEIRLNQHHKILKSIPSSWPVRTLKLVKKSGSTKNELTDENKEELQNSLLENSKGMALGEGSLAIESDLLLVNDEDSSPQSLTIDINRPMAVVASSRGIVDKVIKKNNGKNWDLVIQHEFGFSSYYKGLENISVKEGDLVNRLSQIGTIGNHITANNSVQPKLQYQIKIANKFVNPRNFLIFNY